MSKVKNLIIYILSVLVAFETGILVFVAGVITVEAEMRTRAKKQERRRVSYSSYYNDRRES